MMKTLLLSGVSTLAAGFTINGMTHDIQPINKQTFDQVISMNRGDGVAALWLYYPDNAADKAFLDHYNTLAKELKGMVKIAAVNCQEQGAMAKEYKANPNHEKPQVVFFAPPHQPAREYEGDLTNPDKKKVDKLKNFLLKNIPGMYVKTFEKRADYDNWIATDPEKSKVVLFGKSDKPSVPTLLKALSTDPVFRRALKFGYVQNDKAHPVFEVEKKAAKQHSQGKLPGLMVLKGTGKKDAKREFYDSDDFSFTALHDFINVHSESGMGDKVRTGGAGDTGSCVGDDCVAERLQQFDAKSAKSLCFGQKNMCAIYLSKGPIEDAAIDNVLAFDDKYGDSGDRGVKYSWMWADVDVQKELFSTLQEEENRAAEKQDREKEEIKYPTMIFVKPPKKKREEKLLSYVRLPQGAPVDDKTVGGTIELIAGGTTYTRANLPGLKLAPKPEKKKDDAGKTEL